MKHINIPISIVSLIIIVAYSCSSKEHKGVVDISKDVIMANISTHQAYDVEVCNSFLPNMGDSTIKNFYTVYYYQKESDTLRYHGAHVGTKEIYDKCDYKWDNDSTITFKLFNEKTKKEETYTAWGKGNSSSLKSNK